MEQTLLKDMPIHMERIENNYSLLGEIADTIEQKISLCFNSLSGSRSGGDNATEMIDVDNLPLLSEKVLATITDFVNQNYVWKGLKA